MSGKEFVVHNVSELEALAARIVLLLEARALVLISGPLGIGKTKMAEVLLRELGFAGVSSPTFTIHQNYNFMSGRGAMSVDHFDLYRLENESDLESSGLYEALKQERGLVIVEWADRLPKNFQAPGWQIVRLDLHWQKENETRSIALKI